MNRSRLKITSLFTAEDARGRKTKLLAQRGLRAILKRGEQLFRMFRGTYFAIDSPDVPAWIDHVSNSFGIRIFRFIARSVLHSHLSGSVTEKWKRKSKFVCESGVFFNGIKTNSENLNVFLLKIFHTVPEPGPFSSSPRRIRFRIEPQNHVLSAEIRKGYSASGMILNRKIWSFFPSFE